MTNYVATQLDSMETFAAEALDRVLTVEIPGLEADLDAARAKAKSYREQLASLRSSIRVLGEHEAKMSASQDWANSHKPRVS